mgnify:CR=1 FL=1|tara:strand:- start:10538 stop:10897 length:360 start_codon:yes stop_codon:yes gene_type:complete
MPLKSIYTYDDCTRAGDSYTRSLRYLKTEDEPYNLTDYTFRAQLRESILSTDAVATFTCSSPDPIDGRIDCTLSAEQTGSLVFKHKFKWYVFDVEVIDPSGKVSTIIEVNLKVNKGVTR